MLLNRFLIAFFVLFIHSYVFASERVIHFGLSDSDAPLSSNINMTNKVTGLFPELLKLIFQYIPEHQLELSAYPWARSQLLVENGELDGLLTYPSNKMKPYVIFTKKPNYIQDYGYLIFHKGNLKSMQIKRSKSFDDLSGLTVVLENGSGWETDNIPTFLNNVKGNDTDMMMHLLLLRRAGDFLVMPPEVAKYIASKFSYEEDLSYTKVEYINDSLIPFHVGLSKKLPGNKALIKKIESVMINPDYLQKKVDLVERYR